MPRALTIAIPAHNDTAHLLRLLPRLAALGLARQIIVVDDGSTPAIDAAELRQASGLSEDLLLVLRQDPLRGAGAARNLALSHVTGSHLLFLDADDLPTRALRTLWQSLDQADPFDFCLFQHHDSRMSQDGLWGQMPFDQQFWRRADLAQGALRTVSQEAARLLVQTANYPWNKIYRTTFLRDHAIRCSETLVHNDIALHWRSFLKARRILSSDHVGVIHFVHPRAARLTNRIGTERLRLFEPLEQVALEITANRPDYALPFFGFALGLMAWAWGTLQQELQPQFVAAGRVFLTRYISQGLQKELQQDRPADWQRVTELFDLAPSPSESDPS